MGSRSNSVRMLFDGNLVYLTLDVGGRVGLRAPAHPTDGACQRPPRTADRRRGAAGGLGGAADSTRKGRFRLTKLQRTLAKGTKTPYPDEKAEGIRF